MDKNTELRAKSTTQFGKLLQKNMNLSSNGKQMENVRKKRVEFVTS